MIAVVIGIVTGVLQAWAWSQLAPGVSSKVLSNGAYGQLPTESAHMFASVAIFTMFGLGLGILGALAMWQIRRLRGLPGLLTLMTAAAGSGLVGYFLAPHLVSGVDAARIGATGQELVVVAAPVLDSPVVMVAQIAAAAVVYSLAVFLCDRSDLDVPGSAPDVSPSSTA